MQLPSHIVSVEWMREVFHALWEYIEHDRETLPEHLHKIIHNPPADVQKLRQWILSVCEICKIKPSQLARQAGLSPSTVNRFVKSDETSSSLNAKTIVALERAGAYMARRMLDERPIDWSSLSDDPESLYDHPNERLFAFGLIQVPVFGMLALNGETLVQDFEKRVKEEYKIVIPSPEGFSNRYLFAFELIDYREERIGKSGRELVVCAPTFFDDVELQGDERVIIVQRPRLETVSSGIRELSKDDRGNIWLMPLESDVGSIEPSFLGRERVPLQKGKTGIPFVVLGSYRSFEWAERVHS